MPMRCPPDDSPWWANPLFWVEMFVAANLAFLTVDIGLAHAINSFEHRAEWIPIVFSLAATLVLLLAIPLGGLAGLVTGDSPTGPPDWRRTALPRNRAGRRLGLGRGRACWLALALERSVLSGSYAQEPGLHGTLRGAPGLHGPRALARPRSYGGSPQHGVGSLGRPARGRRLHGQFRAEPGRSRSEWFFLSF